ncbi:MAG TPA: NrfD/PsrC family molybdoenzyme membrane anchor subunit [bacterium]|nr:NrfD/PsrC family molybdoenzyme membrane anchor subunit [bacterium]
MRERTVAGSGMQWVGVGLLLIVVLLGVLSFRDQLVYGSGLTGLSQDMPWGLYIGQFALLMGVAAGAASTGLVAYLYDRRTFGRVAVLGLLLAVAASAIGLLFVMADMGRPERMLNVLLYPHPESAMFWDMISCLGFLVLSAVLAAVMLRTERYQLPAPRWLDGVTVVTVLWALGMHTVQAFLYAGLPSLAVWLGPTLAPRFLATAFASGSALLILACMLAKALSGYDVGRSAIGVLTKTMAYAMALNGFLLVVQLWSVSYGAVPAGLEHLRALYLGTGAPSPLPVWGRASLVLTAASLLVLFMPGVRRSERVLAVASAVTLVAVWLDKGVVLVAGAFTPSPLNVATSYVPTGSELAVTAGIWAAGILMAGALYGFAAAVDAATALEFSGSMPRESEMERERRTA